MSNNKNNASVNQLLQRPLSRRRLGSLALASLGALVVPATLAACSGGGSGAGSEGTATGTIVVGSKDFTEGEVLSEVYALALENAGFTVKRSFDISSSVVHTALTSGDIDFYPEYTGTALLSILKEDLITDPQEVYDTVKAVYKKQFDLDVLDMAKASDSQGLAITTKAAKKYGISNITELQANATNLRFASQGEFDEREDGMPALEKAYGPFTWKEHAVYDNGLKYEVLRNDEADVTPCYTTEGYLKDKAFTLLDDDKKVWPPYNVIPVVRAKIVDKYPDVTDVLNAVSAKITNEELVKLNARVDIDKEDYEDVAADFYKSIK